MNLLELSAKAAAITGDAPIGRPAPTTRPNGASSVTFQGSRGWYDVVDLPTHGMTILFLEGREKPTGKIIGTYYTLPQSADLNAANLIPKILSNLKPLVFQAGYMSFDASGVNWKRYLAGETEILFKSRRVGGNTECEIIVGSLVVAMTILASGMAEGIRKIPSSCL
ncbi:MAG: hypothetical protein HY922_16925 [Elusimicrobia bacterium]|nr:hypothetical protein [Elusimicrobiota bacterium]